VAGRMPARRCRAPAGRDLPAGRPGSGCSRRTRRPSSGCSACCWSRSASSAYGQIELAAAPPKRS